MTLEIMQYAVLVPRGREAGFRWYCLACLSYVTTGSTLFALTAELLGTSYTVCITGICGRGYENQSTSGVVWMLFRPPVWCVLAGASTKRASTHVHLRPGVQLYSLHGLVVWTNIGKGSCCAPVLRSGEVPGLRW